MAPKPVPVLAMAFLLPALLMLWSAFQLLLVKEKQTDSEPRVKSAHPNFPERLPATKLVALYRRACLVPRNLRE